MGRPLLLDLFCGAGGAAMGYYRAGFDVVGVDVKPQPRYPFEFVQADAATYPLTGFDAIHASPPCQDYTSAGQIFKHGTGWLLPATRDRLMAQPAPWVIENVSGAPVRADFMLCGAMFNLRTYRHHRFELDARLPCLIALPPHPKHRVKSANKDRVNRLAQGWNATITGDPGAWIGPIAMGIDWMNGNELSQAIPPAYTEFIGRQLIDALAVTDA